MNTGNPFFVDTTPGIEYALQGIAGIGDAIAQNREKQRLLDQQRAFGEAAGALQASRLTGVDPDQDNDIDVGNPHPEPEPQSGQFNGTGVFPAQPQQKTSIGLPIMPDGSVNPDFFSMDNILHPHTAMVANAVLSHVNQDTGKHDDLTSFADRVKNADDSDLPSLVAEHVQNGVEAGKDMSTEANLLNMHPDDVRNSVTAASRLSQARQIQQLYKIDPDRAEKVMNDLHQQDMEAIAQKKADAYQQHMLDVQEKILKAGGQNAVHGNYVTDQGTIGLIMKDGTLIDTGKRTNATGLSSNLSDDDQKIAEEIAKGMKAPLTISARAPQNKAIMAHVYDINPLYDEKSYKTGQAASTYWSTGKGAQSVIPFNKVISHLGTMQTLADNLQNGDVQGANKIYNTLATQFGDPNITNFDAAKNIVAGEIVKSIVGAGGGEEDRKKAEQAFNNAQSPEQLRQAIGTVRELMKGQLKGVEQSYKASGMTDDFRKRFLNADAQAAFADEAPKSSHPTDIQSLVDKYKSK